MIIYLLLGILALNGIISLLAALLDWDWFFTAQNTQFIVRRVSRRLARLIYGVLGLILIAAAIYFITQIPPQAA